MLSGDIGEGIVPGSGKHIVWDAGTDWDGEYSDLMRVMVYAVDSQGCPGLEWGDEVPPGGFLLGQDGGAEGSGPSRHVNIPWSYWLSKYEITVQQYCDFLNTAFAARRVALKDFSAVYSIRDATYTNFSGSYLLCNVGDSRKIRWNVSNFEVISNYHRYPADVTWFGAMAFAQFYGYDLPTEAEWEKAARGPDHADQGTHCLYAWGNDMVNAKGNFAYDGNNPATQRPVGYYDGNQTPSGPDMANGFSLYDMTGNASEWTRTIAAIVTTYMTGADNTIGTNSATTNTPTTVESEAGGTLSALLLSASGKTQHSPIVPMSFVVQIGTDIALADDGNGCLTGSAGSGTVSYEGGTWRFTLNDAHSKSYSRNIVLNYSYSDSSGSSDTGPSSSGPQSESGWTLAAGLVSASGRVKYRPIVPTSFVIQIGTDAALFDDGEETLVGSAGGGTISYATGTWSFTLNSTRTYGRSIAVEYSYWGDVSGTGVSYYPAKEDFSASQHQYWSSPSNFFFKTGAPIFSNSVPSAEDSAAGFRVIRRYIPDSSDD